MIWNFILGLKNDCDGDGSDFLVFFEEDDKDVSIWFLDYNYYEIMFDMFKRINGIFIIFFF